ncbi:hypothetical protein JST97_13370 [bacterium]|nr:hypothetical protein [bacterium]
MSQRRGTTVLEMIIALTIVLVVSSIGALLLQSSSRAAIRTTLRTEMQQQALVAMQKILTDLRRSCCSGISIRSGASPQAIAICPLSQAGLRAGSQPGVANSGELLWSNFFLIYSYDAVAHTLNYREWPPSGPSPTPEETDPTRPRKLSPGRIAQILNIPSTRPVTLLTGLSQFEISYPPGGSDLLLIQPITLKVTLQRKGNTGHPEPETYTYRRSFFLPEQR